MDRSHREPRRALVAAMVSVAATHSVEAEICFAKEAERLLVKEPLLAMAPVRFFMVGSDPERLVLALVAGLAGAALAVALADRRVALEFKRLIIPGSQVQLAMGAK